MGGHWKLAGRPQGVPLEVGGPPERDSIFQRANQDRQDSQDLQDMAIRMLAHLARAKARLPQARQSSALRTSQAHSWGSWKSCSSWPRRQSREAAWRLPRPPARATQLDIGNIGNWQHLHIGNIPRLPCAAKMAAFPVRLRAQALTGTAAFQAAAFPATSQRQRARLAPRPSFSPCGSLALTIR